MKSKSLRVLNIKGTVFLIAIFSFLFFTQEVFAQMPACVVQPGWNTQTCYRNATYRDTGGSHLKECLYNIQSGTSEPICPTNGTWLTSCNCYGYDEITCPNTVPIGEGQTCNVIGRGTCKICVKGLDNAIPPNVSRAERLLDIDFAGPTTNISPNGDPWMISDVVFNLTCIDNDGAGSGCKDTYYKIIDVTANETLTCDPSDITGFTLGTSGIVPQQTGDSKKKVCYFSVDQVSNKEPTKTSNVFKGGCNLNRTGDYTITKNMFNGCCILDGLDTDINDIDYYLQNGNLTLQGEGCIQINANTALQFDSGKSINLTKPNVYILKSATSTKIIKK